MDPNDPLAAVRTAYDTVARPYQRAFDHELDHKPLERALLGYFAERVREPDGTVADIGCGPGHVTRHLAGLGIRASGIDLSPEMIRLASAAHPDLRFRVGDMLAIELPDAALAGIVALYSIIHLPPDALPRAFAEFARVLCPGGILLLGFHAARPDQPTVAHAENWFDKGVSIEAHLLDPDDIALQLDDAGFSVDSTTTRQPIPDIEYPSTRAYLFATRQ